MPTNKRFLQKPEVTVGLVVGAILTLAIAGTMDLFLPIDPEGWSGAIRKSIVHMLGERWAEVLPVRILFGTAAILVATAGGAVIGALFALFIAGFFRRMHQFIERTEKGGG